MERTDRVTKITAALLFVALLAYIGVYIVRSFSDSVQTAPAVLLTVEEGATVSGIIVRDEHLIESSDEHVSVVAQEGKMLSVGATMAVSMESEAALERINRIRELELEIERVKTLLGGVETAQDLAARDSAIRSAVLSVSRATSSHDLSAMESSGVQLTSLLFDSGSASVTEADLAALEFELSGLQNSATSGTAELISDRAGLFSAMLDGYEHITPEDISRVVPSEFETILQDRREVSETAIGKLICSYTWYFAAVISEDEAARLIEGSYVSLDFGRYYSSKISAKVVSVSRAQNGECTAVFACTEAMAETLAMRQVTAEIIFSEYTGIRVPTKALHLDEEGRSFVYTVTAMQAEKKYVDIIYMADDYCIVTAGGSAGALRDGNEIVVSANDIHEGKLVGK